MQMMEFDEQSVSDLTALVAGSTGSVTNRSRYRVPVLVGQSDIQQGCRWIVPVTLGKRIPINCLVKVAES